MDYVYVASGGILVSNASAIVVKNFHIYTASGEIIIGGCALIERTECLVHKYPIGARVYVCDKACNHGKIEAICIKSVRIIQGQCSPWGCYPPPPPINILYTDTYNTIWEEAELCTHAEAIDCAIVYWERVQAEAARLKC